MAQDIFQIAREHHRAGRLRQAESRYRALLEQDSSNPDAAHGLGVLLVQAGRAGEAIPLLERALAVRPNDPAFVNNLAQAYLSAGCVNEAIEAFDRAIELEPRRVETLYSGAVARLARKSPQDVPDALALLQKARAAGMDSAELDQQTGIALLMSGRVKEALRAYHRAIEKKPDSAEAHFHLGVAYRHAGDSGAARRMLARAVELQPTYARAIQAQAALEAEAGKFEESERLLRKVIELQPASKEAHQALGMVLQKMGRQNEATLAFVKSVRLERENSSDSLQTSQTQSESVAELERKLALSPEQAALHFQLAKQTSIAPPSQIPASSVSGLFDRYADLFDEHLRGKLDYRAPELIVEAIRATHPAKLLDVLDLGCGTGLCGPLLRPLSATLGGVDLSPAMIEKAKERGMYDRLEAADMIEVLQRSPAAYDLLVASDVLMYLGDLASTFEAAAAALRAGGLFAFSVEAGAGERFQFNQQTHRYTHARSYVQHLARIFGFREERLDEIDVRKEAGKPVKAYRVVLRLV